MSKHLRTCSDLWPPPVWHSQGRRSWRAMLGRLAGLAIAVAAMLSTACTAAPVLAASDRLVQQARRLVPPEGMANVYVLRGPRYPADQPLWTMDLDFRGFGTLGAESYLYGWVEPGDHVLAVLRSGQIDQRVRFRAESRRNYFFEVVAGLLVLQIERVDESAGRELVGRYALSGDNRFEGEALPSPTARHGGP